MTNVLIAKNVPLTARLTAKQIWVSASGTVTLVTKQFGPDQPIPTLKTEYLDSLCSRFYYGNYTHPNAIADILLLNRLLRRNQYDAFYSQLDQNLQSNQLTVISSELFQ